jgi:hypothetical protein
MAADRKWLFSDNPFINAAKGSDENGMKQIIFHDAALLAYKNAFPLDPDYPVWYARYHPLALTASQNYTLYYSVEGIQVSQGEIVDTRIKNIKGKAGKARDWYNRVMAIYGVSNPARVTAIFKNGLKPFYTGGKDKMISALSTISQNIGADTNLLMIAIKAEIDAEYAIINPDRTSQITAKQTTGISKGTLTDSITAALEMQFGDLGLEMNKFRSDPNMTTLIKSFHNLQEIQSAAQKVFNPTMNANETIDMVKRTLVFNSKLRFAATSGDVWVYLSSTAGGIDSTPVKVINGIGQEITAAAFGITDYGLHCHITAVNQAGVKVSFLMQLY